jgi:RNA polymerase sigma factor for flagellar operon FliA
MAVRASEISQPARKTRKPSLNKRDQLIVDHLPLVKFLAQRMAAKLPPSVEVNDLVSAGVIGLSSRSAALSSRLTLSSASAAR